MAWKVLGIAMVAGGLALVSRGVLTLRDPPLPSGRVYYKHFMSRQIDDIGSGSILAALGVLAYRRSRR